MTPERRAIGPLGSGTLPPVQTGRTAHDAGRRPPCPAETGTSQNPEAPAESPVRATRQGLALGAAAVHPAEAERPPLPADRAIGALLRCGWHTCSLLRQRRLRQPRDSVGRLVHFGDGSSSTVYRETVVEGTDPTSPAVLVVGFRLRGVRRSWCHALFRLESELNTVLFAGFPGLVSKLWLRHDQHGTYRGIYQWDGPELAVAYVRALWWVLAVVSHRASIHYAVLPGLHRDEVLDDPHVIDRKVVAAPAGWWRPVTSPPAV